MLPLVLTLLALSPFTVVLSHYGNYGSYGYHGHHYDSHSDESSNSNETSSKYFSCPSSSTRHYGYPRPPPRPKPSSRDCSFKEEFPEGTTLNVTCLCPKYSNFEISSDGSTYDNSVKCDGSKYISTQVDSNVFLARETKSASNPGNNYKPYGYNGYYGRQNRHYYGGSSYGKPNSHYGSNYGSHGSYGSHGKPSSDSKIKCVVTPVTEPTTTAAPTTEAPTTAAPTTEAPTTAAPTTEAPTTAAPTTEAPTTAAPTTEAPTTAAPTTAAPTTAAPTTAVPTTPAVTTPAVEITTT